MSSVSPTSEFFPDLSDSVSTSLTDSVAETFGEQQGNLPLYLRRALSMLDLQPDVEIAKYRTYKDSKLHSAAKLPDTNSSINNVLSTSEEDEEEYEEIPPSEPFAVMEHARTYDPSSGLEPPGELVFREIDPPAASLDLSLLPPGEISSARNEYLPASQELWRSLGKPAAPVAEALPKWKLPVAIGSSIAALAAVGGMTYVNLHPALLQQVPIVAQLTAPAALPAIPPGQNLAGPDLAMGEFSDLGLGNINSITLPGSAAPVAQTPVNPAAPVAPPNTVPLPNNPTVPAPGVPNTAVVPPSVLPSTAPVASPAQPSGNNRLADTLVRNLLPPNIQQMAQNGANVQTPNTPLSVSPNNPNLQAPVKPYVPQAPVVPSTTKGSKKISSDPEAKPISQAGEYRVMAKYVNPIGLERIRAILPSATRTGDRIDLGSFSDKAAADKLVARLQQQGISAWRKQG
jgi:hypothetical protein